MSFLLDTDIASAYLRGSRSVFNRFIQHTGGLHISILSISELYSWVFAAKDPDKREAGLLAMLSEVVVLPVSDSIARHCGATRAELQRKGIRVPTIDMLIASTALVHDLTVASHNQKHFRLVPGLRIEDWLAEADH